MARELRRLFISPERLRAAAAGVGPELAGALIALSPQEIHYVARVLRFRQGDRLALIDGEGHLWTASLESPDRLRLEQPLTSPLARSGPVEPRIILGLAVPKRDADLVWRMATELGASGLQPLIASRGVVHGSLPLERWRLIAREATEQCERLWVPRLTDPVEASTWFAAPRQGPGLLATTRREGLPTLAQLLTLPRPEPSSAEILVAIGPEGGWSAEEEGAALESGWQAVSLGSAILRTSTAAVASLAWLAMASDPQS